jgi:hypothetical protein
MYKRFPILAAAIVQPADALAVHDCGVPRERHDRKRLSCRIIGGHHNCIRNRYSGSRSLQRLPYPAETGCKAQIVNQDGKEKRRSTERPYDLQYL